MGQLVRTFCHSSSIWSSRGRIRRHSASSTSDNGGSRRGGGAKATTLFGMSSFCSVDTRFPLLDGAGYFGDVGGSLLTTIRQESAVQGH